MLTVCCSGSSERGLDSHRLPSWVNPLWCDTANCLKAAMKTQVTLLLNSLKISITRPFHASMLCWFYIWVPSLTFRCLDHRLCWETIEEVKYHLHLCHITFVFTFTPVLCSLLPGKKKKKKIDQCCVNVSCPWFAVVHRNRNQVGGSEGGHIWESRATVSHRGCSPDNLLCWCRAKAAKN